MREFKTGDRVIVLPSKDLLSSQKALLGKVVVVKYRNGMLVKVEEAAAAFYDYELEHEDIYNSPLYKALS